MSSVEAFGDLKFRTISPDEIARTAYYALLYGLQTDSGADAEDVVRSIRDVLPILDVPQLAMLLTAPWGQPSSLYRALKADLEQLTS